MRLVQFVLIIGFGFMGSAHAQIKSVNTELMLFNPSKKTYEKIQITEHQGYQISANCLKKSKEPCLALKAISKKMKEDPPATGALGNPAARYCHNHNANNRILLDSKKREYDYCIFSDGSALDSWSLYKKHFGT